MSNKNSETSSHTSSKANDGQVSAFPRDAIPRRHVNIQRMQNILLIWLDNSIDSNNEDCRNSITELRRVVNDINIYTNGDQCIQFIESITNNKVCIIISDALAQHIVPRVHNMCQVDSIFIFCGNKKRYEEWAKEWAKIKGVFTEITPICEALKQAAHQCEKNAISISFVATNTGDDSNKTLDRLDLSFMYTQILKEILLVIKFEQKHINEFIDYCREVFGGYGHDLKHVDTFAREYHYKTPIWWYTWDGFLYPMLNSALRLMNGDVIVRTGFFISDLHRHIEQLHLEQYGGHSSSEQFTVYRGQGLSKEHFEQLTKTKDGLISFNNFLFTSKGRDVSLAFTESNQTNPDLVGILFIMNIDPAQSTTSFASIHDVSYFQGEDEVLFSMHSVFRINDIKPMVGNDRLYEVYLTLTSDNDPDLLKLTDRIREESSPDNEGWDRLGSLLLRMGQSDTAQEVYEVLLDQTTNESEKGPIYGQLGLVKYSQGKYQEASTFYEKSLAIYQKTLSPNHLTLANSYICIANVHDSMDDYPKALSFHEKALEIQQQSLPPNHPDLAQSYDNIGVVYYNMGDYPKALSSDEKALAIQQQSLPPNHPDLGASYLNTGTVYHSMGDYPKALPSYLKALAIQQQSLPPNHPDLATSYNNIGMVYESMGDYPKALSSYKKALEIQQQSLPLNHPDLAQSYGNIGVVYYSMGDYPKALSSYEKALAIQQQSLPPNHPDLARSYGSIGNVYTDMNNYPKALPSYLKALAIQQQSLPPNHPSLGASYNNIGNVYYSMGDYPKALSSREKALAIQQQSLPPNHPSLGASYNNIGNVYYSMGDYPKALSSHEKALAIQQQSLPFNHPDLASSYNNIGTVYEKMRNDSKARSFYERAVDIAQHSLPSGHPNLRKWRKNLERVKHT